MTKKRNQWELLREEEEVNVKPEEGSVEALPLPSVDGLNKFVTTFDVSTGGKCAQLNLYLKYEQTRLLNHIAKALPSIKATPTPTPTPSTNSEDPYGMIGSDNIEEWLKAHPGVVILYHIPPSITSYRCYYDDENQMFHIDVHLDGQRKGATRGSLSDRNPTLQKRCLGIDPDQTKRGLHNPYSHFSHM